MAASPLPTLQYLVAFNNNAVDDPALITTVASPPGTLGGSNVWTDITRYCTGYTLSRGRTQQQFEAGTCDVQIDGRTAGTRFNPWDTTGPYGALVTLRKPFQVRAVWLGVTYYRFTGQVDSWATVWPTATQTGQDVHSTDLFRILNTARIPDYPGAVLLDTPAFYLRLNDSAGTTHPVDSSGNGTYASLPPPVSGGPVTFGNANGALLPIDTGTCASVGVGTNGGYIAVAPIAAPTTGLSIECWFKGTGTGNLNLILGAQYALEVVSGAALMACAGFAATTGGPAVNDGLWHHLAGVADLAHSAAALYIDGVSVATTAPALVSFPSALFTINGGSMTTCFVQEVAFYPQALSAAQVAAHYAAASYPQERADQRIARGLNVAGWNAGARNLDTNTTTIQANTTSLNTSSLLSHMQAVEATESGALYMTGDGKARLVSRQNLLSQALYMTSQATLGDNIAGGDIPFLPAPTLARDDLSLYNEAVGQRSGGAQQAASNNASIIKYGRSTGQPTAGLIGISDGEVLGLLAYMVNKYSNPVDRFSAVTVDLGALTGSLPALVPAILTLDLLQRITVERTVIPGNGVSFTQVANIQHLAESVTPTSWTITLDLAIADVTYWILGTGQLGTTTTLGF